MKRKYSKRSSDTKRKIAGGVALATTLAGSAATTTSQASWESNAFSKFKNWWDGWWDGKNEDVGSKKELINKTNTITTDLELSESDLQTEQKTSKLGKFFSFFTSFSLFSLFNGSPKVEEQAGEYDRDNNAESINIGEKEYDKNKENDNDKYINVGKEDNEQDQTISEKKLIKGGDTGTSEEGKGWFDEIKNAVGETYDTAKNKLKKLKEDATQRMGEVYSNTKRKLGDWTNYVTEKAKKYPRTAAGVVGATATAGLIATGAVPAGVALKILTVAAPLVTDAVAGKQIELNDRLINSDMVAASTVLAPYVFSVYPSASSMFEKIGFGLVSACGSAALGFVLRPKNLVKAGLHFAKDTVKSAFDAGKTLFELNEEKRLITDAELNSAISLAFSEVLNSHGSKLGNSEKLSFMDSIFPEKAKDEIYKQAVELVEKEDLQTISTEQVENTKYDSETQKSEKTKVDRIKEKIMEIVKERTLKHLDNQTRETSASEEETKEFE